MLKSPSSRNKFDFVLVILIVLSFFLLKGFPIKSQLFYNANDPGATPEIKIATGEKDSLQIKTFGFVTPAPTQSIPSQPAPTGGLPACSHDTGQSININNAREIDPRNFCSCPNNIIGCENKKCSRIYKVEPIFNYTEAIPEGGRDCNVASLKPHYDSWCNIDQLAPHDGIYCVGKPIIYLYPTEPTYVDLSVKTSGKIVVSDPQYPPSGWKNIFAQPNGSLRYNNQWYRELFYETNVADINPPQTGLVIEKTEIEKTLKDVTYQLGLTPFEQSEFLEYWLPILNNLNSPYLFISILEPEEKKRIDTVVISPEPDTRIEFIAYFKPLMKKITVKPLQIPDRPARRGFTMVEWGGTIETKP